MDEALGRFGCSVQMRLLGARDSWREQSVVVLPTDEHVMPAGVARPDEEDHLD